MLNRREFIRVAAGATASMAALPLSDTSSLFASNSGPAPPVRLSVCIDMIMTEIPFLERIDRVKRLGYPAFEFWEWKTKDVDAIIRKKNEIGLGVPTIMGFCR